MYSIYYYEIGALISRLNFWSIHHSETIKHNFDDDPRKSNYFLVHIVMLTIIANDYRNACTLARVTSDLAYGDAHKNVKSQTENEPYLLANKDGIYFMYNTFV